MCLIKKHIIFGHTIFEKKKKTDEFWISRTKGIKETETLKKTYSEPKKKQNIATFKTGYFRSGIQLCSPLAHLHTLLPSSLCCHNTAVSDWKWFEL